MKRVTFTFDPRGQLRQLLWRLCGTRLSAKTRSMAAVDPRIKSIKIKTGVVKRLAKEKTMYHKEIEDQTAKVEKMKQEGKDEHDVKKQEEVLQESVAMIPDSKRRLTKAWDELNALIGDCGDLSESEEYKAAQEILENSKEAAERS